MLDTYCIILSRKRQTRRAPKATEAFGQFYVLPVGDVGGELARIYDPITVFCKNRRMSDQRQFTLRQIDQARSDFAAIESDLQFIMGQLARVPTRGDLVKTALGIIFCSVVFTILLVWIVWH